MIKVYGAPIDEADVGKIVDYLAANLLSATSAAVARLKGRDARNPPSDPGAGRARLAESVIRQPGRRKRPQAHRPLQPGGDGQTPRGSHSLKPEGRHSAASNERKIGKTAEIGAE